MAKTFNIGMKIPTSHRDAFRALIRTNPGYEGWRCDPEGGNGVETRLIRKDQHMRAVVALGLESELMDLLATPVDQLPAPSGVPGSDEDESEDEREAGIAPVTDAPAIDGKGVLDAISPYVSGMVLDLAKGALAPLVDAANAKQKVIEKVVYEQVALAPGQTAPPVPFAKEVDVSTLGKMFKIRGKWASVPLPIWDAANAPKISPLYVPDSEILPKFVTALNRGTSCWFAGPSGGGKSTLPEQVAAVSRRPFVCLPFHRAIEPTELVGMDKLSNGNMVWKDGAITQAIRTPGTIILLDEITFCPPGIAAKIQALMSSRSLTIETTGEVVRCAKGVYFCAADNTRGYGDDTGLYAGTMQANRALINRFGRMIIVDYMSEEKEAKALANMTGAPRAACERVTTFVAYARKLPGFGDMPLSLRNMESFVNCAIDEIDLNESFDMTFLNSLPEAEREALRQAFRAQFRQDEFLTEMSGKTLSAQAPVSDAPEQVQARSIFPPVDTQS